MALTVRTLAAQHDLGVRILAGASAADRPITWVHVSELDDPTPFLAGGELLLTTGLFVREGVDLPAYLSRLGTVGVLGLGFGVGLSHESVPAELVAAADDLGLPLLEVPRRTPFIALSRAVSRSLAADEYAAVTRTFTAQQELTKAALAPDSPARLIRLLARKIDGWVALLDGRGAPVAVSGERAGALLPVVAAEVARLREHRGSVGAGFEIDGDSVSLQPVGTGSRRRAFLAIGRPGPLAPADRHLVNAAVMLLTLGLEQDSRGPDAVGAVRAAALELAFAGHLTLARSIAERVGDPLPDDPVVVLVVPPRQPAPSAPASSSRADQLPPRGSIRTEWDRWDKSQPLQPRDGSTFGVELDGDLVLLAPAGAAAALAAELGETGRPVGHSAPTAADGLADALRQARRAAAAAADRGLPALAFPDIAVSGVAGLWNPTRAAAFAESLLAPLVEHDRQGRGDLVDSLRAWLAHHGQWDPAAAALGVHRHTLRRRMGLAGRLLGRDLDSPTVRSELWLALSVAGRTETERAPDRKKNATIRTFLPI